MADREEICRKAQSFFNDLWTRGDPWELETSNWEHERYALPVGNARSAPIRARTRNRLRCRNIHAASCRVGG